MTGRQKRFIGRAIIAFPFTFLFALCATFIGIWHALAIFGGIGLFVVFVGFGVFLTDSRDKKEDK